MKASAVFLALVLSASAVAASADQFSFSADSMTSTRAKGKERTILKGSAKIVSGGTVITAACIELYGTDYRFALCTGQVTAVDEQRGMRLMTENLYYDRVDKVSRLEGFSTLEDKKNKLVIKGGYIENDERTEIAVIRIGVRVLKDDMVCRSEYARYDRAGKSFELSGDPRVKWKGDDYSAEIIIVDLETDDIVMKGSVRGSLTKEDPPAVPKGEAPAEPAPPVPGDAPGGSEAGQP
ncbi:MAG: hypothetical protein NT080_10605 [Spirochaetes bacterium]|nr:hypothetical protein [Spirochaetota bacterium]